MSAAMSHRPRGRIMLVGEHEHFAAVVASIRADSLHAPTIYDAIGRLTASPGGERIATIVVSDAELHHGVVRAAEALRQVDPSVQTILLGASRDDIDDEYDIVLHRDAPFSDLSAVLTGEVVTSPATDASPAGDMPPGIASPPAPSSAPPSSFGREHRVATAVPPDIDAPPASADRLSHGESLGDVDLVEALLTNDVSASALALRLIREQTGWADLSVVEVNDERREVHACVIEHHGERYGWLTSVVADERMLEPWAEWLGHWMALELSHETYRTLAYTDDLTGAHNRRYYEAFMERALPEARERRRPITVMVFDLDNFKQYNDTFGHEAGDLVLTETVRLLKSVIRSGDRVCRIGGDEFAVVFADLDGPREAGSVHPDAVEVIARRFQDQIQAMRFPKLGLEALGCLSISAGIASYPWDGHTGEELLRLADQRALESKRKGKNLITFGPTAGTQGDDR